MNTDLSGHVHRSSVSEAASSADSADVFRRAFNGARSSESPAPGRARSLRLSIVIPVYNGSQTIGRVVNDIRADMAGVDHEIILVNDGSADDSEQVCAALVEQFPDEVVFLQLARNFGEHNAVLAGLKHAVGEYVAILDDDGQNGPGDVLRMLDHAQANHLDVVYGRYADRKHPPLRILGSWFNDRVATILLKKPRDLYLSSFKVMSRLVVDEVCRYNGPLPYLDGLILRATRNVGQIDVQHHHRLAGRSGYTLSKLISLWMNMFMGYSLLPVRVLTVLGILSAVLGVMALAGVLVYGWLSSVSVGGACIAAGLVMAGGIQLFAMGILGEYVARIFLHQSGTPQHVLRYVCAADQTGSQQVQKTTGRAPSLRFTAG